MLLRGPGRGAVVRVAGIGLIEIVRGAHVIVVITHIVVISIESVPIRTTITINNRILARLDGAIVVHNRWRGWALGRHQKGPKFFILWDGWFHLNPQSFRR